MTIKLYEASAQVMSAIEQFTDPETGEISGDFSQCLEVWHDKGQSVCAYIKNIEAEAALLEAHINIIKGKLDAKERSIQRLKNYLCFHMAGTGITEIKAADGTFKAKLYRGRDMAVEIAEGAQFDEQYLADPKPREPSKAKIKAALDAGIQVEGARIVKRDRLTIS